MATLSGRLVYSNLGSERKPAGRESLSEIYLVENFVVGTNTQADVYTAAGVPAMGDAKTIAPANGDPSYRLYVTDKVVRSFDPVTIWEVHVAYVEDPKNIPAKVNRYATHKPYPVWADNTNHVPRNIVGDIFMPPLSRTRSLTRIEVVCRISKDLRETIDFGDYCDHKSTVPFTISWTDGDGTAQTMYFESNTIFLDDIREVTVEEPFTHYLLTAILLEDKKKAILGGVDLIGLDYSAGEVIEAWMEEIYRTPARSTRRLPEIMRSQTFVVSEMA